MPTLALAMHIDSMGPVEALGFVVPLTYFIFIIFSTLAAGFLALDLHRFRRGGRIVLAWQCSIIGPAAPILRPTLTITPCAA